MSERRLRIAHVTIQPVLVWDDGEELTPGPDLQAFSVPISKAIELVGNLPGEVAALADRLSDARSDVDETT
jgi:hypothetical protein